MKKYIISLCGLALLWTTGCKKTVIEQITQITRDTSIVKLPEYVITDYGAIADGKTDCGPVINKIINIMPASGGTIIIPIGDFLVNTTINVNKSFITISGLNTGLRSNVDVPVSGLTAPGGGSKLILGTATSAITVPLLPQVNGSTNRVSGLEIKNLLISGGATSHGIGINILQDNDGTRIDNVVGINLTMGLYANASDAMIINSCWISECQNSINLANGIQNTITDCQLGAQPGGITVKLDNQQNFSFTGNQVYPDGNVNLQLNNSTYGNISSNNFQSYYVGVIELNSSDYNIINDNIFWMRIPSDPTKQLRGNTNDYGVLRIAGNGNLISSNSITCDWVSPTTNPVTINSLSGTSNTYDDLKISDISSSRVFDVDETTQIVNCVPASKVFVNGDAANVFINY